MQSKYTTCFPLIDLNVRNKTKAVIDDNIYQINQGK